MDKIIAYSHRVKENLVEVLEGKLIGLYLTGSQSLRSDSSNRSDIDLIGILSLPLSHETKDKITTVLNRKKTSIPAAGLDLILMTKEQVNSPSIPGFEFWFSSGVDWPDEAWESGQSQELYIFIELCRRHGIAILGPSPAEYFPPIPKSLIIRAFIFILNWHQEKILDPLHDPGGQNSILNACRMLAFNKRGVFMSKSQGGIWFLRTDPNAKIVGAALQVRNGNQGISLTLSQISSFLTRASTELGSSAH